MCDGRAVRRAAHSQDALPSVGSISRGNYHQRAQEQLHIEPKRAMVNVEEVDLKSFVEVTNGGAATNLPQASEARLDREPAQLAGIR